MATLGEQWAAAGTRTRGGLVAGLVLIASMTAFVSILLLRDPMEPLASDLSAEEAAATVEKLEEMKVEYALDAGGTRVLVPRSKIAQTRVALSGEGVRPGGPTGFEIFDEADFGMTEFAQRINFQRAMQGELARTIGSMGEIRGARVHLVLPERGLFGKGDAPASAAVHLRLESDLSDAQVEGIQDLVASSVQGLERGAVRVIDQSGVTLSSPIAAEGEMAVVSSRLDKKREVERYLRDKVVGVLEDALGPGRSIVSIDVSLEMDQVKTTEQRVVTRENGQGWVTRERESRSWKGSGADEEVPGNGDLTRETEFAVGRETREIVPMPGALERLSVGVLVRADISAFELSKLREVVAMTVGFEEARGDSISMHLIDAAELDSGWLGDSSEGAMPERTPSVASAPVPLPSVGAEGGLSLAERISSLGVREISMLATAAMFFLLVAVLVRGSRRRERATAMAAPSAPPGTLSAKEREALLGELRVWLAADERDERAA